MADSGEAVQRLGCIHRSLIAEVYSPIGIGRLWLHAPFCTWFESREQTFRLRPHPKVPLMLAGRVSPVFHPGVSQ